MSESLRVLLVEDSVTDAKLIIRELQRASASSHTERVENALAMRAALEAGTWDAIISDWSMPTFSGLEALAVMKDLGLDLPFILVSGTVGEESAVEAMRAGAHDYVLKGKLARLVPALEREVREARRRADQRRAEETLRMHEARFRAVIEHSQDGIMMTSREGKVLYMSPAAKRILAVADSDFDIFAFIHPDDRARVAEFRARFVERPGATETLENRALLPDGSIRWLEIRGTNLLHVPALEALVSNVRDVTESKKILDALHASEARFARLSASGIIGIATADVFGNVHEANDAYLDMLGYTREEALSGIVRWGETTPPEWREADERAFAQLEAHGVARPWEKELFRKDGTRLPILIGVAMLDGPNCIAFVADLTAQKQAEAALRGTEEQLRQAQKMEAVGRLAGGVAHDFNNLLSVILSYCHFMGEDLEPDHPMRADIEEVRLAGERAADLTRQLLAFSRQQVIEPKILDLDAVLSGMEKMLRRLIGEDIDLRITQTRGLGKVKADPGHVEQVVMNLVVNARDAMRDGGKLTIETANIELDDAYAQQHLGSKPGPHVMIAISDTGTGMDAATQQHIFEPFFTTKEKGKGTGLGLSTVFGIVKQSGGTIWVYSEIDRGTTFKVYLPRTDEIERDRILSAELPTVRGEETILLVEDDDQVRTVVRGILKRNGYAVLDARNGAEALQLCEQHTGALDLLLTDVVMPVMGGRELSERVAKLRPGLKVLFMSGYTEDAILHHRILVPGIALLQKPLTPDALLRKVRSVLDKRTRT